jgi:pyruvate,water dikinase
MNCIPFSQITLQDLAQAGGKNASLGEMYSKLGSLGIRVPNGFAITASAFRNFLKENKIEDKLKATLDTLDAKDFTNLEKIGDECRRLVLSASLSAGLTKNILESYHSLGKEIPVAVRSSATAEDLPTASFAGQHESFLNVHGDKNLLDAVKKCFASLYKDRAIKYRAVNGFGQMQVALSVGVQKMVRSDIGSSGVAFTLEPETGFRDMIYITGIWGLGENIVQGAVSPDEYYFFKPSLKEQKRALITKKLGAKEEMMIYSERESSTENIETPVDKRTSFTLSDKDANELAQWCLLIEQHYNRPMDIEWAKDGDDGGLYIVQARPETIHGAEKEITLTEYKLTEKGKLLASGKAVGHSIVTGVARILHSPAEGYKLREGEILVTDTTSPDWNAVLRKAAVIVTNKGGRTSHASIVARELGLSAVVGCLNATEMIRDGQELTVSCAEGDVGKIYEGKLSWQENKVRLDNILLPETDAMLILADPDKALKFSQYPNKGVGLLRMEFIINNAIRVHPMALVKFDELKDVKAKTEIEKLTALYPDKEEYFVDKLAEGVAMVAAAFYPKDVIVRMSDFKTNEYANLLGGKQFEPSEENPMIGFRGASRYYNERYREGFRLECEAMKVVREQMGFHNVKLMIPFCRTVEEGKKVTALMSEYGLKRGENGLEIYVMAEIPSNVILAEEFSKVFDGFSIGSNDLTQLTLGIDRDSAIISDLFNERNAAAMWMISTVIQKAKLAGVKIGLCGQAPSDYPEFARFLVDEGIDSISFNPDALLKGIENIKAAEIDLLFESKKTKQHG